MIPIALARVKDHFGYEERMRRGERGEEEKRREERRRGGVQDESLILSQEDKRECIELTLKMLGWAKEAC